MAVIAGQQSPNPAEVLCNWFQNRHWTEELYLDLANGENAFVELSI